MAGAFRRSLSSALRSHQLDCQSSFACLSKKTKKMMKQKEKRSEAQANKGWPYLTEKNECLSATNRKVNPRQNSWLQVEHAQVYCKLKRETLSLVNYGDEMLHKLTGCGAVLPALLQLIPSQR